MKTLRLRNALFALLTLWAVCLPSQAAPADESPSIWIGGKRYKTKDIPKDGTFYSEIVSDFNPDRYDEEGFRGNIQWSTREQNWGSSTYKYRLDRNKSWIAIENGYTGGKEVLFYYDDQEDSYWLYLPPGTQLTAKSGEYALRSNIPNLNICVGFNDEEAGVKVVGTICLERDARIYSSQGTFRSMKAKCIYYGPFDERNVTDECWIYAHDYQKENAGGKLDIAEQGDAPANEGGGIVLKEGAELRILSTDVSVAAQRNAVATYGSVWGNVVNEGVSSLALSASGGLAASNTNFENWQLESPEGGKIDNAQHGLYGSNGKALSKASLKYLIPKDDETISTGFTLSDNRDYYTFGNYKQYMFSNATYDPDKLTLYLKGSIDRLHLSGTTTFLKRIVLQGNVNCSGDFELPDDVVVESEGGTYKLHTGAMAIAPGNTATISNVDVECSRLCSTTDKGYGTLKLTSDASLYFHYAWVSDAVPKTFKRSDGVYYIVQGVDVVTEGNIQILNPSTAYFENHTVANDGEPLTLEKGHKLHIGPKTEGDIGLIVAGIGLSSKTAGSSGQILFSGGRYEVSTKELVLFNTFQMPSSGPAVTSSVDGLTISFSGGCPDLTAKFGPVLVFNANATILNNTGVLTVATGHGSAISVPAEGVNLTIKAEAIRPPITISTSSNNSAILGNASATLTLGANITLTGTSENISLVKGFGSVVMADGYGYTAPLGVEYNTLYKDLRIADNSGFLLPATGTVEVGKVTNYNLYFNGERLNSVSAGKGGTKGFYVVENANYNRYEVYMNENATLYGETGFKSTDRNISLYINGSNRIAAAGTAIEAPAFSVWDNSAGSTSTLVVRSINGTAIETESFTAKNMSTINVEGTDAAIGMKGKSEIVIGNAAVTLQCAEDKHPVTGVKTFTGAVQSPQGAVFNATHGVFELGGKDVLGKVVLCNRDEEPWPVKIAGTQLTNINAASVCEGVSYHKQTNTLTFEDAEIVCKAATQEDIAAGTNFGIWAESNLPLTIVLKGYNRISVDWENVAIPETYFFGMYLSPTSPIKVCGPAEGKPGTLHVDFDNTGYGVTGFGTLEIEDVTFNFTTSWGLTGVGNDQIGYFGDCTVRNANMTISTKPENQCISMFNTFTMEDCYFAVPFGGEWNAETHRLEKDGEMVFGHCRILSGKQPEYDPADLNGDDTVNVGDVTTLVNMILGKAPVSESADLNKDGSVNVGDVTSLVNIILGK